VWEKVYFGDSAGYYIVMAKFQFSLLKLLIAIAIFALGLAVLMASAPRMARPESAIDEYMGFVVAIGLGLCAAAVSIPFAPPSVAMATFGAAVLTAIAAPFLIWWAVLTLFTLWKVAFG
jgi:hypothetical protein